MRAVTPEQRVLLERTGLLPNPEREALDTVLAVLDAVTAERDHWRAEHDVVLDARGQAIDRAEKAERERDAARTLIASSDRTLIHECAKLEAERDDLAAIVETARACRGFCEGCHSGCDVCVLVKAYDESRRVVDENNCESCKGWGYDQGPHLGDEPCPKCKGTGKNP